MTEQVFTCRVCGIAKARTSNFFYKNPQLKDGLSNSCKDCCREARKARRKADPEKWRAIERRERSTPEYRAKKAARARKSREANREEYNARNRAYYAEKKASPKPPRLPDEEKLRRAREAVRSHWLRNKDRYRVSTLNYVARKKGALGTYSLEDINEISIAQGHNCYWCATPFDIRPRTVDHYISLKNGGTNWPSNLVLSCKPCNSAKRDREPEEFKNSIRLRSANNQK